MRCLNLAAENGSCDVSVVVEAAGAAGDGAAGVDVEESGDAVAEGSGNAAAGAGATVEGSTMAGEGVGAGDVEEARSCDAVSGKAAT